MLQSGRARWAAPEEMALLRTTLEHISRYRILRRKLRNGRRIYVSPDSQLKYWRRIRDDPLADLAESMVKPESIVWDIGANCGVFAFSAFHAKSVLAVEPDPFLAALLQRSAEKNSWSHIRVLTAALSDAPGVAVLNVAGRGRASNHLALRSGRSQTGGYRSQLLVPTMTLDALLDLSEPPTFLKIDVEGAEASVLRGGHRTLEEIRPTIAIEVGEAKVMSVGRS